MFPPRTNYTKALVPLVNKQQLYFEEEEKQRRCTGQVAFIYGNEKLVQDQVESVSTSKMSAKMFTAA